MVKFKELLGAGKPAELTKLADFGAMSFGKRDITDKTAESTPHYEFEKGFEMYENNPIVSSALDQLILFLYPNKKIKISSKNEATKKFLEEWCAQRPNLLNEFKNILLANHICGNGPAEKRWGKTTDNKVVLDNVFASNDMLRLFINPNADEKGTNQYFYVLPIGIRTFRYMGEDITPNFETITYIKNYQYTFRKEWGFYIPKHKLEIYQSGFSRFGIYGRAPILSAIDGHNVYKEIISSWDTIARTRQIDQKIISLASGENPIDVSQERLDQLGQELEDNDKSYILFNTPLQFVQQDVSVAGKYDLMENVFDLVRRMIIMSLLPQHLTPWSDSATTQGSEAAMPPFMARIKAKQNEFAMFLKTLIIDTLRLTYEWLDEDAEFEIDEPKIMPDITYIDTVTRLRETNVISLRQSAEYLDKLNIIEMDEAFIKQQEENPPGEDTDFRQEKADALKESVSKQADVGWDTFKTRLQNKSEEKMDFSGWREAKKINVGGKALRIIETPTTWMIYDGLTLHNKFNREIVKKKNVALAFKDLKDHLLKIQEEFENEDTEEDKIIDELNATIKAEYDKRFKAIIKHLDNSEVKKESFTEGFLSKIMFGRVDDAFKGFSDFINKSVGSVVRRLGATVVDDGTVLNTKDRDTLKTKNDIMVKNIQSNVKGLKDDVSRGIKDSLTQGMTAGRDIKDIKSDLESKFDYKNNVGKRFDRAVHKNLRNSATLLRLQKWKRQGFEEFEWITRGDTKVRPKHAKKNRRVFNIQDALDGKIIYPSEEWGCRCRAVPYS